MQVTRSIFALILVLAIMLTAFGSVTAQDDVIRIAAVMPSSITDLSWSQSLYDSLIAVQAELGGEGALEIAYTEGLYDPVAGTDAFRDYAEQGYDIVIAHGGQYGSVLEVALEFPDTTFLFSANTENESTDVENAHLYIPSAQEGGYVNGVMAGLLTESNVIGVVGPVPASDALLYINGFQQGVHAVNPEATVNIAYTGSYADTALAAETARAHIDAGADILTGTAQQVPGAIEAIKEAGGLWFATQSDQSGPWPGTVAATQSYDFSAMLMDVIEGRAEGIMGGNFYDLTLANGGLEMLFNEGVEVPADVMAAAEQAIEDVSRGSTYVIGFLPEETFRVAIVMPSSVTDLAWSQSIYDALLAVQQQMGGEAALEIAFTEGMFDVTAAADALRDYAEQGYNLVIAHGTQYGSSLRDIAPDFPETSFAWGTATDTFMADGIENVFAYEARAEEGGYINGVIAGLMTESGVIGVVGPVPAGDALLYINGFAQGVAAANPDATTNIAYTGSFGDTALAAETARAHIDAGADILTGSAQQVPGAIQAIEEAGGFWFATQTDQSGQWPETVIATQEFKWDGVIAAMIDFNNAGSPGNVAFELSLANGGLNMLYSDALPEDVVAAAEEAAAAIIAGEIVVERELPE